MTTTTTPTVFQTFTQLSNVNDDIRRDAVAHLIHLTGDAQERAYAVKRLTRGLCSSRAASRQGFAVALCELLRNNAHTTELAPQTVLDSLDEATKISHNGKSAEDRDKLVGRGFGYLALIQSEATLQTHDVERITRGLSDLAQSRVWLREFAASAACLLISTTPSTWQTIIEQELIFLRNIELTSPVLDPECMAVLLAARRSWNPDKKLKRNDFEQLVANRVDQSVSNLTLASARTSPPRLHGMWNELLACMITPNGLQHLDHAVQYLWRIVVNEFLLVAEESSPVSVENTCMAFLLLDKTSRMLGSVGRCDLIPSLLLTPAMLRELVHHGINPKRPLCDLVRQTVIRGLQGSMSNETGDALLHVCVKLTEAHSKFDSAIKTNIVSTLIKHVSVESATKFLQATKTTTTTESSPATTMVLMELAHALPSLVKDIALFFFEKGFFSSPHNDDDNTTTNKPAANGLRGAFFHVLGDSKSSISNMLLVLREVQRSWTQLRSDDKTLKQIRHSIKALGRGAAGNDDTMHVGVVKEALELLTIFVGVLSLAGTNEEEVASFALSGDVSDMLQDLESASCKIMSGGTVDGEPEPVAVIVDVMLALLAQPSALVRDVVGIVAKGLAGLISNSKDAIDTLVSVLVVKEVGDGEADEEDEEEDLMDEEDAEQQQQGKKDVPTNNNKKARITQDNNDEATDDDDDDNVANADEDRALLAYAAMLAKNASTGDEAKKIRKRRKREAAEFKLRALDLVEAVLKACAGDKKIDSSLLCAFALPFLRLYEEAERSEETRPLAQRLRGINNKLCAIRAPTNVDVDNGTQIMTEATRMLAKSRTTESCALPMASIGFALKITSTEFHTQPHLSRIIVQLLNGRSHVEWNSVRDVFERFPVFALAHLRLVCETPARTSFQRGDQIDLVAHILKLNQGQTTTNSPTMSVDDIVLLWNFAAMALCKEEDEKKGKNTSTRVRAILRLAEHIAPLHAAVVGGKVLDVVQSTLESFEQTVDRVADASNSPGVKHMAHQVTESLHAIMMATPLSREVTSTSVEVSLSGGDDGNHHKRNKRSKVNE